LLFDYETEEEAKASLSPKLVVEILGVSEWDGKGRANSYPGGFLLVTHTGGTYYVSVTSPEERDEWILQVRKALECVFANPEVAPFKPSKIIQNRPPPANNMLCPITHQPVSSYSTMCRSCGRSFASSEHVAEPSVILQLGYEEMEKVCLDCKNSQLCVLWLKSLNYAHTLDLHELTPTVLTDIHKFKASFRVRRRLSQRLDMAADLYDGGNLTAEEFEELRAVDHAYRREMKYEECHKLKVALEAYGDDIQTLLNVLMDSNLTEKGGIGAYFRIISRIFELADTAPDLVDFFFPQLFQVHLLQASDRSPEALRRVDILQQALLVLAQKYSGFATKLAWSLLAVVGDYEEKRASQVQFAACVSLLMQLEMVIAGTVSAIADVPASKVLQRVMRPALHQQQELGFEIGALFLIRRKLQEAYDGEEQQRLLRNQMLYRRDQSDGDSEDVEGSNDTTSTSSSKAPRPKPPLFPGANCDSSCLDLLYQLGVGQDNRGRKGSASGGESEDEDVGQTNDKNASNTASLHKWEGFSEQLDFVDRLNELVDSLRFVDRPLRTEMLHKEVAKWNAGKVPAKLAGAEDDHLLVRNPLLGWDPVRITGEPQYRITRIVVDECRVFRTKARAPSLIICEVMRDDLYCKLYRTSFEEAALQMKRLQKEKHTHSNQSKSRGRADSTSEQHFAEAGGSGGGAWTRMPISAVQQSMQDVETLVESSLNPAIADLRVTIDSSTDTNSITINPVSVSADGHSPSPQIKKSQVRHGSMLHLPKTHRSSVLPFNRLSASTEGILRSSQVSKRPSELLPSSQKLSPSPPPPGDWKTTTKLSRSVSTPALHGGPQNLDRGSDTAEDGSVSSKSADDLQNEIVPGGVRKVATSAHKLLQEGLIDQQEYEQLLHSDLQYREEVAREEAMQARQRAEVALGESFASKKERILAEKMDFLRTHFSDTLALDIYYSSMSEQDYWPPCDLRAFIVKTNDDLRQEICCLQLMQICKEVFDHFGLSNMLFLKPYRIVSTGSSSGLVEVLTDAMSLDALKKTPGFTTLSNYFKKTYDSSEERMQTAKHNFMASLAAYSLFSYLMQIKDRHNGNLLLDSEGHIIHIDFGFLLSIAPGGSFSLETAPFKLTEEMVELLGGLDSPLFGDFVTAFTKGFIALQANCENILSAISLLAQQSSFPCFQNKPVQQILDKLRARFRSELNVKDAVKHCLDLITNSYGHYGTRQYDNFQYYTNGILP
jgi:phosphatidylinositol 4-kinase B